MDGNGTACCLEWIGFPFRRNREPFSTWPLAAGKNNSFYISKTVLEKKRQKEAPLGSGALVC